DAAKAVRAEARDLRGPDTRAREGEVCRHERGPEQPDRDGGVHHSLRRAASASCTARCRSRVRGKCQKRTSAATMQAAGTGPYSMRMPKIVVAVWGWFGT